jgi:phosphatidate cytidylyltransferase
MWLLVVPFWLYYRWKLPRSVAGFAIGVLVIAPTWLALVQLRELGAGLLLAVMSAVWLADIAAYFFGRWLGKHKLAPSISPGKTWEGAIGGTLAVVAYGLFFSVFFRDRLAIQPLILVGMLLLFAALSIIGDLFESLLKRQAAIKDSSNLLPGHGGVLDRIDSLTSTLPLVACVWFFLLD